MLLNTQIYADIVTTLKELEAERKSELRRTQRLNVQVAVLVQIARSGQPAMQTHGLLRDLSTQGVGLLLGQPLAANTRFIIHFPRTRGNPVTVLCECRHCHMAAEGIHAIGAEFKMMLAEHIVTEIVAGRLTLS